MGVGEFPELKREGNNLFSLIINQFQKIGIFIQRNLVKVQRIIVAALVIEKAPTPEESTIGEETILSGTAETMIYNNNITPTSKIFVTFRGDYGGRWWASEIGQGYFKITLSETALHDTPFDYWIIGVGEQILEGDLGNVTSMPLTTPEQATSTESELVCTTSLFIIGVLLGPGGACVYENSKNYQEIWCLDKGDGVCS